MIASVSMMRVCEGQGEIQCAGEEGEGGIEARGGGKSAKNKV